MDDGDLSITINGSTISGWTEVRVTRALEYCPNDFDIALTEKFPGEASELIVQPGDACVVTIGDDPVITGYVDRFVPSIGPSRHEIRIQGRGKCQDMVDCAAEWPNGQITGSNVGQIATKLAAPYGITVSAQGDVGPVIPQFNLILGETAYEIVERISRYRGLLAYEQTDGSLYIGPVGTTSAASGFIEGQNIQEATFTASADERFSEYQAMLQSTDVLSDIGDGGNLIQTATDSGMKRHRRMIIIAEAGGGGSDVAKQRALWECARRAGRANRIDVTVDSWRDANGTLWAPNTLAPLSLPSLKAPNLTWLIGTVTYLRDEQGTRAEVMLMPPDAFKPEPILLQPFPADVTPN